MNNRDFSNIGEEIRRTVEDAMNSMDYGQLNQRINQTVNMAMDEARKQFGRYNYGNRPPHVTPPHVTPPSGTKANAYTKPAGSQRLRIRVKTPGRVSGPFLTLVGGLGALGGIMLTVASIIMSFADIKTVGIVGMFTTVFCVLGTCVMLGLFGIGLTKWSLYRNFKQYFRILDGREFCAGNCR